MARVTASLAYAAISILAAGERHVSSPIKLSRDRS